MTWLIVLLAALAAFWLLGLRLGRGGEDLARYDRPLGTETHRRFGRPQGPSPEHAEAVERIRAMGGKVRGLSRKQIVAFSREFLESVAEGREFDCQFRPVDAGGVPAVWVLAPGADPNRRVLYLHGGAFIAGSPNSHRTLTSRWSALAGAAVLAVDYRLMPEHPRRAGIEDCRAAYRWILDNGPDGAGKPERLYMSGDSAGGNLSLSVAAWARDAGLRPADAVVALSPLTDSTYSGPSIRANVMTDIMLGPLFGGLMKIPRALMAWLYLAETRYRQGDPDVSPVFGDLAGLPPTLIQVSEAELLLDDARRYVAKARAAGTIAVLHSWPGLLHVWQVLNPEVPEAEEAFARIGEFLRSVEAGEDPGLVG